MNNNSTPKVTATIWRTLFAFVLTLTFASASAQNQTNSQAPSISSTVKGEWQLVSTIDGVSCYSKTDHMGSGTGVYLRFVNTTNSSAVVKWTVNCGNENSRSGKVTLSAGQTADSVNQPVDAELLVVRIAADNPVITFTVSK